jgi:diguanylate cyclase (GGDEF)-like protein
MWVAVLVGVAATIVALPPDTAFPHASVFQSLLTALWIASTLGRCALVGLYSATIRSKLGERNRKLASTKHLLETMVSRDGLTGAANRTAILDYLDGCLHEQADTVLALVFMDLDHFKLVNDAYGHLVGDRVLRQFVEITMGVLRHDARMGRYGGEEFLLVLPGLPNSEAALAIAERVRTCILEYPWGSIAPSLALTVSAGIAYGKAADTSEAMVKRADAALYAAKSAGRNCTRAEVEMPESADSERRVN